MGKKLKALSEFLLIEKKRKWKRKNWRRISFFMKCCDTNLDDSCPSWKNFDFRKVVKIISNSTWDHSKILKFQVRSEKRKWKFSLTRKCRRHESKNRWFSFFLNSSAIHLIWIERKKLLTLWVSSISWIFYSTKMELEKKYFDSLLCDLFTSSIIKILTPQWNVS